MEPPEAPIAHNARHKVLCRHVYDARSGSLIEKLGRLLGRLGAHRVRLLQGLGKLNAERAWITSPGDTEVAELS